MGRGGGGGGGGGHKKEKNFDKHIKACFIRQNFEENQVLSEG